MSAPIRLTPRRPVVRVVEIYDALHDDLAAYEGLTPDEADALHRALWDARRHAEGLEIVPVWPVAEDTAGKTERSNLWPDGRLAEIEGF